MIVCFWQFATAVMDQRKAKRMIGLVGSGGIVGGIVSGFGLKLLVQPLGTENLIFIYAGLQFLCLVLVRYHLHKTKDRQQIFAISNAPVKKQSKASRQGAAGNEGLFKNVPHLKYVALMAGSLVISLTFIDFQFKVILRGTLQNEALAGFMGSFYGFAGLLALFIQFFVSGRLITRFGVMMAILVFPIALFAGSFSVLLMPVLAMAVMVKGSDKVLGDTIYSSVSQLIMFPISPEWRGRAKGFLDGVVRNGAKGVAAISLIVLSKWFTVHQFSYFILALIACCIYAAIRIKAAYLKMLLASLQTREIDLLDAELD
jgi:ATP/ADP translocase